MPVDRGAWPEIVTEQTFPKWECPNCGHTISVKENEIVGPETGASLSCRGHEAWDPEWIHGRFVASYECAHCQDPATMLGSYTLREGEGDPRHLEQEYFPLYRIQAIEPAPALIRVPDDLPEELTGQLHRAFRLFWVDRAACANAIRGVVEEFLNQMRVRKTDGSRSQRGRLSLHKRIELYSDKDEHLSTALMAMKWIGNAGSHASQISRQTLFDGFDLLEHVLEEAFNSPRQRAARLARNINRRRGRTPNPTRRDSGR